MYCCNVHVVIKFIWWYIEADLAKDKPTQGVPVQESEVKQESSSNGVLKSQSAMKVSPPKETTEPKQEEKLKEKSN